MFPTVGPPPKGCIHLAVFALKSQNAEPETRM